ncbi:MAG: YfhO family protein [Gemmatimonadota bacterium]
MSDKKRSGDDSGDEFFPPLLLIGSYVVLAIALFMPALMPGMQIFGTDYLAISYIFEEFVTHQFQAGELPKWIPYVYGGVPYFANSMDIYYPVSLVLRLIGVPTYKHLAIIFVVQFVLAGWGTYALLRELGARRFAAWLTGLSFMFSGYLISYVYGGHDGRTIVATLAPFFLFALHRAVRTGGLRWFALGGFVLGSAMLSFQIQSAYYVLLAGGLWGVFLLFRFPERVVRKLSGAAFMLTAAFALNAVNFLPFAGYVDASPRAGPGRGYEYATSWSMPPVEITGLAVPEQAGILDAYRGANPFKLHTEYLGAFALLLAVVGVYVLRRDRVAWFFGGLALFILTIAFGGYTPIYRLYYAVLPGTARFRAPSLAFFLFILCIVVVAGLALDRLSTLREEAASGRRKAERAAASSELATATRVMLAAGGVAVLWGLIASTQGAQRPTYPPGAWRFVLFTGVTLGALWAWLRGKLPLRAAGILIGIIVVTDLWVIDRRFIEAIPGPDQVFPRDEIVEFLSTQDGPFRTFVLPDLPQDDYLTLFDLEIVGGEHGNQLQAYNEFLGTSGASYTDFSNMNNPVFLALANARYVLTQQNVQSPIFEPVFQGRTRNGRSAIVYRNTTALPRAFVVAAAEQVPEPDGALRAMQEEGFDPLRAALVYDTVSGGSDPSTLQADARVTRHDPARVDVEVQSNQPAFLVLTDNYYPDWVARVDDAPARVLRAYHTFRAVPIPAGTHTVTFTFEPPSLRIGLVITLLAAGVLLVVTVVSVLSARRAAPPPESA